MPVAVDPLAQRIKALAYQATDLQKSHKPGDCQPRCPPSAKSFYILERSLFLLVNNIYALSGNK
ncbi:hypothetical protein T4E_1644 [Trichinella pseudospiralis]|uniref:Uncharacterized protein n=1 Tax=Trichinella pseudospiralis TaxID=6337 RepID=A0A0V0YN11_TRIPS|nr:hypothetical protein T4E_1644 [Trichinella pseudospiralis]